MATNYDMEAIHKAYPYPEVCTIECGGENEGVWDADGNKVTLDQAKVDAARVELNKLAYKAQRAMEYPHWNVQLDYIYHNGIDKWKTDIVDPIKAKYPKPS